MAEQVTESPVLVPPEDSIPLENEFRIHHDQSNASDASEESSDSRVSITMSGFDDDDLFNDRLQDFMQQYRTNRPIQPLDVQNDVDIPEIGRFRMNNDAGSTRSVLSSIRQQIAMFDNTEPPSPDTSSRESLLFLCPSQLSSSSHSREYFKRYYCKIMINDETFLSNVFRGNDDKETAVQSATGVFDLSEFYGPTNVLIQILEQLLPGLPLFVVATKNLPLYTFAPSPPPASRNNREERRHVQASPETDANAVLDPRVAACDMTPHSTTVFVPSLRAKTCLTSLQSLSSPRSTNEGFHLTLRFSLLPLRRCTLLNTVSSSSSSSSVRDLLPLESLPSPLRCSDLHIAAAHGSEQVVTRLLFALTRHGNIRRALALRDSQRRCALDVALMRGNIPAVRVLLSRAGHLCFQGTNESHRCALHYAVLGGSKECLFAVLRFVWHNSNALSLGSNLTAKIEELINWRDERDDTPGMALCKLYSVEKITDGGGLYRYKKNRVYTEELTPSSEPSSSSEPTDSQTAPAIKSSEIADTSKVQGSLRRMLSVLLLFGCDVSLTNSAGQTMLMLACKHGHLDLVKKLLRQFQRPSGGSAPTSTSSSQAARAASMKALPWARDVEGNSSLFYALQGGRAAIVHLLVQRQLFSLRDANNEGNNVFHLMALSGNTEAATQFIAHERKEWAAYLKESQQTSVLVSMYTRPKLLFAMNVLGRRPIDIAMERSHRDYARLLCEAAAEIYGVGSYPRLARDRALVVEMYSPPTVTTNEAVLISSREPVVTESPSSLTDDDEKNNPLEVSEEPAVDSVPSEQLQTPVDVTSDVSPSSPSDVVVIEDSESDNEEVKKGGVQQVVELEDGSRKAEVRAQASMMRRKSRRMFRALERAMRDPLAFIGAFSKTPSSHKSLQQEATLPISNLTDPPDNVVTGEVQNSTKRDKAMSRVLEAGPGNDYAEEEESMAERDLAESLAYNLALLPEPHNLNYLARFSAGVRGVYGDSGSGSGSGSGNGDKAVQATAINDNQLPAEAELVDVSASGQKNSFPVPGVEGEEKE